MSCALQQSAQASGIDARVAKDPRECSALQLSMKGNGEGDPSVRMLQSNVASSLANDFPPIAFECLDEALTRNDR
jgi:hypothetical protein